VIGNLVRRDAIEPGHERHSAPLEPADRGQRLAKHIGRQIFSDASIANAMRDERIDAPEMRLVQRAEAGWILLRRLDQSLLGHVHRR
jgi:hypothetical protein